MKFLSKNLDLRTYKCYFVSLLLLISIFSWRQISFLTINNYLLSMNVDYISKMFLHGVYYLSMVIGILTAAILSKSLYKLHIHFLWGFFTVLVSALMLLLQTTKMDAISFVYSVSSGALFGLEFPLCFAYFAKITSIQERGRVGAIIFFIVSLIFAMFGTLVNTLSLKEFSLFAMIWMSIAVILLWKMRVDNSFTKREIKFKSIISSRSFLLYFVSWGVYCSVDLLEAPLLQNFLNNTFGVGFRNFILLLGTIFTGFSILTAGFLIDFYGRKKVLLYGFVTLGIAYATISIAPYNPFLWYLYSVINGIATGFFIVILLFTIWGDLSPHGASEKYYAIGGLPYISIVVIREIISPYVILIPVTAAFSFASFFLFLAVVPLMYAPETLPEKVIRERELRRYVERAKKIREKYERQKED